MFPLMITNEYRLVNNSMQWLAGFKPILNRMGVINFKFFIHVMLFMHFRKVQAQIAKKQARNAPHPPPGDGGNGGDEMSDSGLQQVSRSSMRASPNQALRRGRGKDIPTSHGGKIDQLKSSVRTCATESLYTVGNITINTDREQDP